MKSTELHFLEYPCRVVVCESCYTPGAYDHETHDSREYARIIPETAEIGGMWVTKFEFAGTIEWSKHAWMLTDEHRAEIEAVAAKYAAKHKEATERAKELQAYQREKYAAQIARFGE